VAFDLAAGKAPGEPTADHLHHHASRALDVVRHRSDWTRPGASTTKARWRSRAWWAPTGASTTPRLLNALGSEDEQRIRALLPLWRFEPGLRGGDRVPVKVRERTVFRIFY
jgi:hypothetical protein